MRHIERDINIYLDRRSRIKEYEFKVPFPFTITDVDMFGNPIEVTCVITGITHIGNVLGVTNHGDDYSWSLTELDSETLFDILIVLELGNFKTK